MAYLLLLLHVLLTYIQPPLVEVASKNFFQLCIESVSSTEQLTLTVSCPFIVQRHTLYLWVTQWNVQIKQCHILAGTMITSIYGQQSAVLQSKEASNYVHTSHRQRKPSLKLPLLTSPVHVNWMGVGTWSLVHVCTKGYKLDGQGQNFSTHYPEMCKK